MTSSKFEILAKKIALNLIDVSIRKNDVPHALDEIIKNENQTLTNNHKPERFIFVIGAGVSKDANENIQLGGEAADSLREVFKEYEKLINHELRKLKEVDKRNPKEFETVLLAISKFDYEKKLENEIFNLYNYSLYPSLTYEVLAHLFKHKFIDCIINFNFDEVLDRAIDDEINQGEYYKVISDGDAPSINEMLVDSKFKKPIYIKPHGTASHKSSMRYTDEDYWGLPKDIELLINDLVSGKTDVNDEKVPVNVIVVGFEMQSIEFNKLLLNLPEGSEIFFIKRRRPKFNTEELEDLKKDFYKGGFFQANQKNQYIVKNNTEINLSDLDKLFLEFWKIISNTFKENYSPRCVSKHILISKIFKPYNNKRNTPQEIEGYLKDRIYLELAIAISKSKGFLTYSQLINDRVGLYYNLYKNHLLDFHKIIISFQNEFHDLINSYKQVDTIITKTRELIDETLDKISDPKIIKPNNYNTLQIIRGKIPSGSNKFTTKDLSTLNRLYNEYVVSAAFLLKDFCRNIGLIEIGYSREALIYNKDKYGKEIIINKDRFYGKMPKNMDMNCVESIIDKLKKNCNISCNTLKFIIHNEDYFMNTLKQFYDGDDIEISPKYSEQYNIFSSPIFLPTKLAMKYYTNQILCNSDDWDALLIVSETGDWLLNDEISNAINNRKIILILADEINKVLLKKKYEKNIRIKIMPWWKHNEHMTIFIKRKKRTKNNKLLSNQPWEGSVQSIYFKRKLRDTSINPVLLKANDGALIAETFFAYYYKGKNSWSGDVLTKRNIRSIRKGLIEDFLYD